MRPGPRDTQPLRPIKIVYVQCYQPKSKTWEHGFRCDARSALNQLRDFLNMRGGGIGRVIEGSQVIAYLQIPEPPPF